MTYSPKPFAVFIIGTGRSGTSLAAQALAELGLLMPDDLIPANETNLRGTGESIAIRDRMLALSRAPEILQKLRVSDWLDSGAARETMEWAAEYMAARRDAAGGRGFIIKFPLSSIFLPLWIAAAERIGLDLRFLWATRGAANVLRSLIRAYDRSESAAQAVYALRSFYILRDAPAETLLLPYEGWARAPEAQVDALARLIGADDPARREAAISAFADMLDHTAAESGGALPEPLRRLDDAIRGESGLLGDILAPGSAERARLMVGLADLIEDLHPKGRPFHTRDAMDARLGLISALAAQAGGERPEMKDELEVLAQRIRDVTRENRELTQRLGKAEQAGNGAGAAPPRRPPEAKRSDAELARLREEAKARDRMEKELGALRERALSAEREAEGAKLAYADLTRERDALEDTVSARWLHELHALQRKEARQRQALERLKKLQKEIKRLRVRQALHKSQVKRLAARSAFLTGATRAERREIAAVAASPHFDAEWYLKTYPDVGKAKMAPAAHFVLHGLYEGRSPGPKLNTLDYYIRHPKALANGVNPVLRKGRRS